MKKILILTSFIIFILLLYYGFVTGTNTVYVSPGGNDRNPGTTTKPVKTIQRGVSLAQRGGTVKILPGTYRETITISDSNSPAPMRLYATNENGRTAVVLGSEPSSALSWHRCADDTCSGIEKSARNKVYVAVLPWDEAPTLLTEATAHGIVRQLSPARSPNEKIDDPNKYHEFWWQAAPGNTDATTLFDPPHLKSAPQMSDGRAFIIDGADRCGTYMYVLPVKAHNRTSGSIETGAPIGAVTYGMQENGISQFTKYYVDNAIGLLDAPGEWFYDKKTKTLYLWPLGEKNPEHLSVEIARRDTGVHINRSRVIIDGLSIRNINDHDYFDQPTGAITIVPDRAIHSIRLHRIHSSHAGYGIIAQPHVSGRIQGLVITGSRMEDVSKSAITIAGSENELQNIQNVRIDGSVIRRSGFPFGEAAIQISRVSGLRISSHDIRDVASYGIHITGFEKKPQIARNILVSKNSIERACQNSSGCAALKIFGGKFTNTVVEDNTLRDTLGWSFCKEAAENIKGDGIGLFISNAGGITVSHNRSIHQGGIAYLAYTRQIPATHNIFYGNIAAESAVGIAMESGEGEKDTDPTAYNSRHNNSAIIRNILENNGVALSVDPAQPEALTIKDNVYKNNGTALLFRGMSTTSPSDIFRSYHFWEP